MLNTTKSIINQMNLIKEQYKVGLISEKEYNQMKRVLDIALMGCDN